MRQLLNNRKKFVALIVGATVVISGVFAGTLIVINDNNKINFGVGQAPVNPCDPDVTVNIIVDRVNENQYLTGFTYSFVDKPACVGYDIETRMLTASDQVKNLFATSSLASDPTVIRVFSTSSTSTWQLGKGAFSGLDATVTQLSQSSFQVTFVNPVLLASDLGKILTAEIPHLPLGTFTGTAKSISWDKGWKAVSTNSDATSFYIADITAGSGYVWKSNTAFTNFSTSSLQRIDALPHTGDTPTWESIAQSGSGKYVVAAGDVRRAYFTQDYGSTWDNVPSSAYYTRTGTLNSVVSMSADGAVVCLIARAGQGGTGLGSVINIWKDFNFYSKSNSDHYFDFNTEYVYDCHVTKDGNTIFVATKSSLFKVPMDSLTSRSRTFNSAIFTTTGSIFRVGSSRDGKFIVIGYRTQTGNYPRWKYSSDYGATFNDSSGLVLSTSYSMGGIKVSDDGAIVVSALYNFGQNGYLVTSNDFGQTFATNSVASNSVYNVAMSDDGSKIIAGTIFNGGSSDKIYFLSSD
jgi:hypothetical protein